MLPARVEGEAEVVTRTVPGAGEPEPPPAESPAADSAARGALPSEPGLANPEPAMEVGPQARGKFPWVRLYGQEPVCEPVSLAATEEGPRPSRSPPAPPSRGLSKVRRAAREVPASSFYACLVVCFQANLA